MKDVSSLTKVDGYSSWREAEAIDLAEELKRRLTALQNPEECSSARKLICNLNKVSFKI